MEQSIWPLMRKPVRPICVAATALMFSNCATTPAVETMEDVVFASRIAELCRIPVDWRASMTKASEIGEAAFEELLAPLNRMHPGDAEKNEEKAERAHRRAIEKSWEAANGAVKRFGCTSSMIKRAEASFKLE